MYYIILTTSCCPIDLLDHKINWRWKPMYFWIELKVVCICEFAFIYLDVLYPKLLIASLHYKESYPFQPMHLWLFVEINHLCNFRYNNPLWHLVKMTCSHINDYKVVCSCIWNLYLHLMLIWMKMKMKNTFVIHF